MDYEAAAVAGVGSFPIGGVGAARDAEAVSGGGDAGASGGAGSSGGGGGDGVDDTGEMNYTGGDKDRGGGGIGDKLKSLTLKGKLKKFGPIGGILAVVLTCAGIFAGSNVAAPFAFLNNVMDQYNNLRTSMSKRSTYMTRFQLDNTRNKPITKRGAIFGNEKFAIGKTTQKKLASNNIDYLEVDGTDGKKLKLLVYNDPDSGGRVPIVANEADLGRVPKGNADIDVAGKTTFDAITLDKALEFGSGFNFRNDMDVSTRTLKGHIAGWFDSVAANFHKRISSTRNKFKDTGDTPDDETVAKAAKSEGLETKASKTDSDVKEGEGEPSEDNPGKTVDAGDDSLDSDTPRTALKQKLTDRAKKAAGSGNIACQVLKGIGAINSVIRALNVANTLNFVTGFLEAINRAQIGEGSGAMNYYMQRLTQPGDTVMATYNSATEEVKDEPIRERTTAWGAAPMGQVFSGAKLSQDDPLVQQYNLDNSMKLAVEDKGIWGFGDIAQGLAELGGTSKEAYLVCLGMQALTGAVDTVVDVLTAVADIPTLGLAEVIKWAGKEFFGAAASMAVGFALGQIIQFVIPAVAQWLAVDLITNMVGEEPAYAIVSGVNMYMGRNTQAGTGTWLTKKGLLAQYRENQEVIAEEAEFERRNLSPLDVTSKNTFLGSIMHSLASVSNGVYSSPLGSMSTVLSGFGASLRSLVPGVSAATDEANLMVSVNEECKSLSSLSNADGQAVGDAFCNPYYGQNFSTIDDDPADIFARIDAGGNFDGESENPKIKGGSDFAKYVVACEVRDTQMGYYDASIGAFTTGNGSMDSVLETGLSAVPVVGGLADIVDAGNAAVNARWANGEACGDPQYADFAQYSIDQKIMEAEGLIEESAISAFLDEYYEQNPLDDSYEGVIARYSGLTMEQTEETLGLMEYATYIANYEPEKAVAMGEPVEHMPIMFESTEVVAKAVPDGMVAKRVMYRDLRAVEKG